MTAREPLFVGCARQLFALNQALARARAGLASVAHVEGEPGSGKTALIRHFAASPEMRDSLFFEDGARS